MKDGQNMLKLAMPLNASGNFKGYASKFSLMARYANVEGFFLDAATMA